MTAERRCLWCGGVEVYPSTRPLRLLGVFRFETWRCDGCRRRFPLRGGNDAPPPELVEPVRRRPAGPQLHALDDTLAKLLKPGPGEDD